MSPSLRKYNEDRTMILPNQAVTSTPRAIARYERTALYLRAEVASRQIVIWRVLTELLACVRTWGMLE